MESRVVGGDDECDATTEDGNAEDGIEEMTDVGLLLVSAGLSSVFDPPPTMAVDGVVRVVSSFARLVVDFDVVAVPLFLRRRTLFSPFGPRRGFVALVFWVLGRPV